MIEWPDSRDLIIRLYTDGALAFALTSAEVKIYVDGVLDESPISVTITTPATGITQIAIALTKSAGENILVKTFFAFTGEKGIQSAIGTSDFLITSTETQTGAAAIRTAVGLEAANLKDLVQAVVGKNVVTAVGDGTYNIAVRDLADTTDLVVINWSQATGAKTVVSGGG